MSRTGAEDVGRMLDWLKDRATAGEAKMSYIELFPLAP